MSMAASVSTDATLRVGLGIYALRWALRDHGAASSCRLLVQTARALGLDLVQIVDNVALLDLDRNRQREVRRAADDAGVHVEVGTRSYGAGDFRRLLRIAAMLDSRNVRVVGDDL